MKVDRDGCGGQVVRLKDHSGFRLHPTTSSGLCEIAIDVTRLVGVDGWRSLIKGSESEGGDRTLGD